MQCVLTLVLKQVDWYKHNRILTLRLCEQTDSEIANGEVLAVIFFFLKIFYSFKYK